MNPNEERLYLYPVWIRIWHMINALLCLTLIVTGLSIQFSSPNTVVKFNAAVSIHNVAGIILSISYVCFFIGNLFTSNGAYYVIPVKGFLKRLTAQFRYYTIGIFKKEPAPFPVNEESKFNPLQQITYVVLMYGFVPVVILSGWGLLYPEMTVNSFFGFSGLALTDLLHILAGFTISIIMCVHIYFCTIGKNPLSNFKSMINGYHESH
ncbi:MAG TPA: cytochrome b/b6 domain-containing protein [Bacteroidales bacterium]|nr:cytochrome b/b6 domain-containing protein [Bacteroidales bacterium]